MKKTTQRTTAEPGSISTGTLRAADLIPTFLSVLDGLREDRSLEQEDTRRNSARHSEEDDLLGDIERAMKRDGYFDSEEADYDLEVISELLDGFAPDGHYFGAHPGDGSDFGFWTFEE